MKRKTTGIWLLGLAVLVTGCNIIGPLMIMAGPPKKKVPPERRTSYSGNDTSARDALLSKKGDEAQWCIFDPIVSAIYGLRFQASGTEEYLDKQAHYLNRSLGQISDQFECPELYYLQEGRYVPGDVVPLLWTQANLRIALKMMEDSLRLTAS